MTVADLIGVLRQDFIDSDAEIAKFPEWEPIKRIWYNVDANSIFIGDECPPRGDWDCVWDDSVSPIYLCDPEKNVECKSRHKEGWCGVECRMTFHKEFSKDGNDGKEPDTSRNPDSGHSPVEVVERGISEGGVS